VSSPAQDILEHVDITDVVVIPPHHDDSDWSSGPPAGDPPIQLLPDLTLTHLHGDEVRLYDRACEPRHSNFDPAGNAGQRYAFVRHPAPATPQGLHNFDPDGVLHAALAMSRYVVLNAHCTEIAVRRIEGLRPEPQIVAVRPMNRFYAWRPRGGTRTHLTQEDAQQLGPLLATYLADQDRLPPRVRGAVWFCETSFRTYYYEIAYVHVVTALESLLKVRRGRATEQFCRRVPALARSVGIRGITRRRAAAFYNRRTRSVHGRYLRVDAAVPATRELAAMQRVLVAALRRAVEDREFRCVFTGPRIEQRWPV
jgi:hypothetical protein